MKRFIVFLICGFISSGLYAQDFGIAQPIKKGKRHVACEYGLEDALYTPSACGYNMSVTPHPAKQYGFDPCENFCIMVTGDTGGDPAGSGPSITFYVETSIPGDSTYEGYYNTFTGSSFSAVICIGADSGSPIDLPMPDVMLLEVGELDAADNRSCGGVCTVMIGG